jgi:cation diffusion facilitator CzcD-associated flavoprotein CzcO
MAMRVIIVGAGLGGLCVAVKMKEAGFTDLTILEQAEKVGGTWRDNRYPGCACDTPVALYQFSFFPSIKWKYLFPRADEVQEYSEDLVDAFGLRPSIRLGEGAADAAWDESAKLWRVTTSKGAVLEAEALVMALGQLNRPQLPDLPGRDDFAGPAFHSARWRHDVSLKGKRVGVIGSAASAVQLIPEVAKEASYLAVYQRTPNWVVPRLDQMVTPEDVQLLLTEPETAMALGAANRKLIYDNADHFFWQAFAWTPAGRAAFTKKALNHLEAQIPDPDLRKKLTPDYPIGCKRILICDDFYPALMRDTVELITDGISRITPTGVDTKNGQSRAFDALIYATGFETTGWRWSCTVKGRGGVSLTEAWGETPEAYLGVAAHGFPNMFMTYGPNTNLGHNTITFMIERQAEWMVKALTAAKTHGLAAVEPSKAAQARYNADLQQKLSHTVWADPHCSSWYKTKDGKITQNWGDHTRAYAAALAEVKLDELDTAKGAPVLA